MVSTVVQAFTKAGIVTELPDNNGDTDLDNADFDKTDPGTLDAVLSQFEGFVDEE